MVTKPLAGFGYKTNSLVLSTSCKAEEPMVANTATNEVSFVIFNVSSMNIL